MSERPQEANERVSNLDHQDQGFFPFAQPDATHCFTHFSGISVAYSGQFTDTFLRRETFWRNLANRNAKKGR